MNLGNLTTQISKLSQALIQAREKGDDEEIERLEVELENLREEIDELTFDF